MESGSEQKAKERLYDLDCNLIKEGFYFNNIGVSYISSKNNELFIRFYSNPNLFLPLNPGISETLRRYKSPVDVLEDLKSQISFIEKILEEEVEERRDV